MAPKVEVSTRTTIHNTVQQALDKAGSAENIEVVMFPNPKQRLTFEKLKSDKYKVVLFGPWGSGKTTLMSHSAKELAKKGKKVLFLVLQSGIIADISKVEPLLVSRLKKEFEKWEDLICVKSVTVHDKKTTGFNDLVQGFSHVFIDEGFADLNRLEPTTRDELIEMLESAKVETAAITVSNSYYNDPVPLNYELKDIIQQTFQNFDILKLTTTLRIPANYARDLQDEYISQRRMRKLHLNEHLMVDANVPHHLQSSQDIIRIGFQEELSVYDVVKKAGNHIAKNPFLVIVNDRRDNRDLIGLKNLITCECDIYHAMYLTVDLALEKMGIRAE
jgi:DNA polymerase III delta prime subunit